MRSRASCNCRANASLMRRRPNRQRDFFCYHRFHGARPIVKQASKWPRSLVCLWRTRTSQCNVFCNTVNTCHKQEVKGKLHSKIISPDLKDFFFVESDGEIPGSKFKQEDGQTDSDTNGTCERLWWQWCHLVIMQGHAGDLKRSWSAGINSQVICRSKPSTLGRIQDHFAACILDTGHQWRNTGRVFVTWDFLVAICLTKFLFDFWPQIFTIKLYGKSQQDQRIWFWSVVFLELVPVSVGVVNQSMQWTHCAWIVVHW